MMADNNLNLGVCATSFKDHEFRLPIHPEHLADLDAKVRDHLFLEETYGEIFGVNSDFLQQHVKNIVPRQTLFEKCEAVILLKPTKQDLQFFQENQILLGWLDYSSNDALKQTAIDKKMTFISFEFAYFWQDETTPIKRLFYKNNEFGGYCSVSHCLEQLNIITGDKTPKSIAVLGFGNTARGAISALDKLGHTDVTIFTRRKYSDLQDPISGVNYYQYECVAFPDRNYLVPVTTNKDYLLVEELAKYDIIVNCSLQDPPSLVRFISHEELKYFKPGTVIIDASLDIPAQFEFGKYTSFSQPFLEVGQGVIYYGVDNSPSYLWRESTYEISKALLPCIGTIIAGEPAWKEDLTIWKAIDIKDGVLQNPGNDSGHRRNV